MKCSPIEIKCPDCGKRARFHEPFAFLVSTEEVAGRPFHRWGSWFVVELFPTVYQWSAPKKSGSQYLRGGGGTGGGYARMHKGLVQCGGCHANRKHTLDWPADAYWCWDIRGSMLWAWDMEHARRILGYIGQERRVRPNGYDLRRIPEEFLSAKVRELVVKRITASLEAEG